VLSVPTRASPVMHVSLTLSSHCFVSLLREVTCMERNVLPSCGTYGKHLDSPFSSSPVVMCPSICVAISRPPCHLPAHGLGAATSTHSLPCYWSIHLIFCTELLNG
jgi:hypothetical protein